MRTLISMSLSGAIVTVVLLVMKPLTRKHLSQRWQYYVWLLVVLRLLLPLAPTVTVPSGTLPSILTRSAPSVATSVPTTTTPVGTTPGTLLPTGEPATSTETSAQTLPVTANGRTTWPASTLLLLIWAIGALAVMIWNIAGYTRFKRTVQRTMVRVTDAHFLAILEDCRQEVHVRATPRLYTSASVASPILLGILHPAIVLPDRQLTDNDLRYALLHELTHARRQDGLLKWVAAIAVSIHWFNPLAYVMQYELNHSCELSCDETVTRQFSTDDRRGYGSMLLAVASMTGAPSPAMFSAMVEDKRNLKERLGVIMSSNKQTKRTTVISIITIVLIVAIGILAGCTPKATTSSQNAADINAIYQVVGELGARLKDVGLIAPDQDVITAMDFNLKQLITDRLYQAFVQDTSRIPGRVGSSPWPEGIEIVSVQRLDNGSYTVVGNQIMMDSDALAHGGNDGETPITLTFKKINGVWLIDDVVGGAQPKDTQIFIDAARSFAEQVTVGKYHTTAAPVITVDSKYVQAGKMEVVMLVKTMTALNSGTIDDEPMIAGELQYLRDHSTTLSSVAKKAVEDDIAYWRGTIKSAMNGSSETNYIIKIVGDVDATGNIDVGSLQVYVDEGAPKGNAWVLAAQYFKNMRSAFATVAQGDANAASLASAADAKAP